MSKFKNDVKYKNTCDIFAPSGIIRPDTVLSGEVWERVLVFEVGNSFDQMFEVVE